jgi:hypothetical protein
MNLVLSMVLFLFVNLYIFLGWFFAFSKNVKSIMDLLLGSFLVWCAHILLIEMFLALLHLINLEFVVAMSLVSSLPVWVYSAKYIFNSTKFILSRVWCFGRRMPIWGWIPLLIVMVGWLWEIWIIIQNPPLGWDTYMYHIPIAALRLQYGDLRRLESSWLQIEGFPEVGELFMLWNMIFFKSQFVVDFVQWPFWIFGTLALIGIARKAGAQYHYAIVSSLIWAFAPVTIFQAKEGYVDLMVASLFFLGLYFATFSQNNRFSILCAGLSFGILPGVKGGALNLSIALMILCLISLYRTNNFKKLIKFMALSWTIFGLLGSYWYLANYYHTGNPLWPVSLSFGPIVWKGPVSAEFVFRGNGETPEIIRDKLFLEKLWIVWKERDSYYTWDSRLTGFGPLWFILGIPSVLLGAIMDKRISLLTIVFGICLLVQPRSWYPRYVMFLPGLGGIALALVLSHSRKIARTLSLLIIICGSVFSFMLTFDPYSFINIAKYCCIIDELYYLKYQNAAYVPWDLSVPYRYLDSNASKPDKIVYGGNIAFVGLLFGSDLRHTVLYFNPNNEWMTQVLASGANWIFVTLNSTEDSVLRSSCSFNLVFEDSRFQQPESIRIRIYKKNRRDNCY